MPDIEFEASAWNGHAEMQPVGGLNDDDLTHYDDDTGYVDEEDEDSTESESPEQGGDSGAEDGATPTIEGADPAADSGTSEDAPTTEQAPTTEPEAEQVPQKLRFKARIDHSETDVELDPEELPKLYQLAQNAERAQKRYDEQRTLLQSLQALSAELGYETPEALMENARTTNRETKIQELVEDGTSREVAEYIIDSKLEKIRQAKIAPRDEAIKADEVPSVTKPVVAEKAEQSQVTDYVAQVKELLTVRPDLRGKLTKLPDEVSKEVVLNNVPVRTAYAEWEAKQARAEAEKIRKEKEIFAQQAETAARAPVRGSTDSGAKTTEKEDPFISAFKAERSW